MLKLKNSRLVFISPSGFRCDVSSTINARSMLFCSLTASLEVLLNFCWAPLEKDVQLMKSLQCTVRLLRPSVRIRATWSNTLRSERNKARASSKLRCHDKGLPCPKHGLSFTVVTQFFQCLKSNEMKNELEKKRETITAKKCNNKIKSGDKGSVRQHLELITCIGVMVHEIAETLEIRGNC